MRGEVVPDDPHGAIDLARFPRALAWHVARRPGGLVALSIRCGHRAPASERRLRRQVRRFKEFRAADPKEITRLKADVEALVGALHQATVENSHPHRQLADRRAHAMVHVLPTQTTP